MPSRDRLDATDGRLLMALTAEPRATALALAERTRLSRNTVQSRLSKLERGAALSPFERRIRPSALGHPVRAFILTRVRQRRLDDVGVALSAIPEVLEVSGLSGIADLIIEVAARDVEDLYRIAGAILAIKGVRRTTTGLVMREMVPYRTMPLLSRLTQSPEPD